MATWIRIIAVGMENMSGQRICCHIGCEVKGKRMKANPRLFNLSNLRNSYLSLIRM